MNNALDDLSKGVAKALDTVPELYHDTLQPAA